MHDAERPPKPVTDWRESLLALAVVTGTWTALMSEALGVFHALSRPLLAVGWAGFAGLLAALAWRHRATIVTPLRGRLAWNGWASVWLATAAVSAAVLLVIALASPPNTNDSLQYHMSRVAHWAAQRSLDHYPTPIERQLWMPPFAEVAVLNLYVLAGSDRLVNLVQWVSMLLCLLGVSMLAARLGARREGQALAALFAVTLPMGILQSTSTQNDYVTALWVVCLAYWAVKAHQQPLSVRDWIAAGLATGLGVLTKATFYGFALPFLLWLGVSTVRRTGWRSALRFALLGIGLVTILNAGAWNRNLRAYGLPLGPAGAIAAHGNETWGWRVVVSNAVRGLTLHLATPYGDVNGPIADAVTAVHGWLGLDVNDPRTTMGEYRVKRSFHEDYAGNPYHTLLVPVSLLLLAWRGRTAGGAPAVRGVGRRAGWLYAVLVAASALAFCALYKWQPTGSRLQLSLFVLWAPVVGLALERLRLRRTPIRIGALATTAVGLFLTVASLRFLLMNPSRPFLPRPDDGVSLWNTSRTELLFINAPEFMPGYLPLIEAAGRIGCDSFGLKIDSGQPEYPFWALLAPPDSGVRLEHIEARVLPGARPASGDYCAILCTYCTETQLNGMQLLYNIEGSYSLYRPEPAAP
ncbi:MAG: hypothetical protein A2Y93_04065 [Chloroflexi bacterium RBG_13_68_17]|nr:MAG: hypothetical protein A2Y93_04065 [Chloroflexi bacterium RBG_13_68_17]